MSFSKRDTLAIKGLAILFMFAYHCFSTYDRMLGMNVSFFPFSEKFGMYLADQLNICVPIFLFLSVYGMTISVKKEHSDLKMNSIECTTFVCDRYIKLMSSFWIPLLFCEIGSLFLNPSSFFAYGKSLNQIIASLSVELLGISEFFSIPKHVGTWWYVSLAILTIFLLPVLWNIYRRFGGFILLGIFLLIPPVLVDTDERIFHYLLCIPLAICCANSGWLERYKSWSWNKSLIFGKILKFVVTSMLLIVVAYVRKSNWGIRYMEYPLVTLMAFLVILLVYSFLECFPLIQAVLIYLGKHSGDMFYIHTFFRDIWFGEWLYSFNNAFLIEAVLVLATLFSSHVMDLFRKLIKYERFINWLRRFTVDKIVDLEKSRCNMIN